MNVYNYIINPETGRKVNIYNKKGKSILKKYLNQMYGGANETLYFFNHAINSVAWIYYTKNKNI